MREAAGGWLEAAAAQLVEAAIVLRRGRRPIGRRPGDDRLTGAYAAGDLGQGRGDQTHLDRSALGGPVAAHHLDCVVSGCAREGGDGNRDCIVGLSDHDRDIGGHASQRSGLGGTDGRRG